MSFDTAFPDLEFAAHKDAWTRAKILHRDISADNILIDVMDGTGFLNDWDLAKLRDDLQKASHSDRSVSNPMVI